MPSNNVENILYGILTGDGSGIQKPASRVEELLYAIYQNGGGGGGGGEGDVKMVSGTTEYWETHGTLLSTPKTIYVYTNYDTDDDGKLVPAIKIGDGVHTVSALSFVASAGIDQQDVDKWNENVAVDKADLDNEILSLF